MTDAQHEWERRAIILLGGGLAYIVTCAIIVLAFMADNEGERNLLIGGLLSSPVFGAAALFALLGITRQLTGSGGGRNTDTPPPPTPPAGGGANVGPLAAPPVQSTSRGLQGVHLGKGPAATLEPELAEGGSDQRGQPGNGAS
jgi:hypothetical protein